MKTLLSLLLIQIPFLSLCQEKAHIINPRCWLFPNIENPMYIDAGKIPLSEITIHTNLNHKIEIKSNGSFTLKPENYGEVFVKVVWNKSKDSILIGEAQFRVIELTPPRAALGSDTKEMSKNEFLAQMGINLWVEHYGISVNILVDSFTILVTQEKELVFFEDIIGGKFKRELKEELSKILKGGERIFITNITYKSSFHRFNKANSIEVKIKQ